MKLYQKPTIFLMEAFWSESGEVKFQRNLNLIFTVNYSINKYALKLPRSICKRTPSLIDKSLCQPCSVSNEAN